MKRSTQPLLLPAPRSTQTLAGRFTRLLAGLLASFVLALLLAPAAFADAPAADPDAAAFEVAIMKGMIDHHRWRCT